MILCVVYVYQSLDQQNEGMVHYGQKHLPVNQLSCTPATGVTHASMMGRKEAASRAATSCMNLKGTGGINHTKHPDLGVEVCLCGATGFDILIG